MNKTLGVVLLIGLLGAAGLIAFGLRDKPVVHRPRETFDMDDCA